MSARVESSRRVVFHADDYGMNAAVTQGILTAFRDGLLTSTSLLANAPAAEAACRVWPDLIADRDSGAIRSSDSRRQLADPDVPFDLGIHLNLTQGRPLTEQNYPARFLDPQGNFPGIGSLFFRLRRANPSQLHAVQAELRAQIERMCDLGLRPTHLNGHQYIELIPQISAMIPELVQRYAIPTIRVAHERGLTRNILSQGDLSGWGLAMVKRHYAKSFRGRMARGQVSFPDQFFGTSHAGRINGRLISHFLSQSSAAELTEIGVHPASAAEAEAAPKDDPWFDPLAKIRPDELKCLCSPVLIDELKGRRIGLGRLQTLSRRART